MRTLIQNLIIFFIFIGLFFLQTSPLFAQTKPPPPSERTPWVVKPFERKAFIENKGQFEHGLPSEKKSFNYCIDKGYQVFFYGNEICYRFTKYVKSKGTILNIFESEEKREARAHKFKTETQYISVKWLNANPNATIIVEDKQSTYYSYVIKNENEKPNTVMCSGYSKLIYKNLYTGIDVEYVFHPENGIEYNLLLHPGADVSQVKMQYSGSVKSFLKDGSIHISTLAGDIIDHAPVSYYANRKEKIASSFHINNNIVSFNLAPHSIDQEIVIDPWTVIPGFTPSSAFDNGVDNNGNIYIYGGSGGNYTVEKYNSTGGAPIWSLANTGIDKMYYGDMLVEGNGNFYLCEGFVASGAHTYKYGPSSAQIWQSTSNGNYREHWRLAINCVTNKVIVAGGGTTSPTLNIAEIDVITGVLINAKSVYSASQSDVAGLCVDETGKAYLKHSNPNIITFTDNANNFIANLPDGYNYSEIGIGGTPTYYQNYEANGYNMMTLGGATFLFTSDGATLKKWDRNTHVLISSATIPGGAQNNGSGILADKCNNIFVGASNGVHRFDFNLVQKEFKATSTAVYDIAYALNSDIVASGAGFITPLPFGRESCGSNLVSIISDPCDPEINTVHVTPTQGIPPYTFFWDDGNTDSIRTNLLLGPHIVTVRDGACSPSFFTDTVIVPIDTKALDIQKTNPSCYLSTNGEIQVTLLRNQTIISSNWLPAITYTTLNDSTLHAGNLPGGSYALHIASSLGCFFDTIITLIDPPILLDSLKGRQAMCPESSNGWAIAFPYGGTSPYTYSWSSSPLQLTQSAIGLVPNKYIVTITDTNSCVKIDSIIIGSNPSPIVSFTTQPVCFSDTTNFVNTSTAGGGGFSSVWLVGNNGDSATTLHTQYYYPSCNNYIAQLTVTSDSGCVADFTDTVKVYCNPVAAFVANNVCTYKVASFSNSSTGAISYSWDFDYNTGTDDVTLSPIHLYPPGNYDILLTATSIHGCTDTVVHGLTIYSKPVANFVTADICLLDTAFFIDSSTVVTDTITNWAWDFGDMSSIALTQNPLHLYATDGTKTISLIVTSNYGCQDTTYGNIIIHPLPVALFNAENVCDGTAISFTDFSSIPITDQLQTWMWDFDDGSTLDTNQNTSHLFATAGTFNVQLLITSNFGCLDSITKTSIVNPNPVVLFSANDTVGCEPLCISFQNSSTILTGTNVNWAWILGDGSTANNAQSINHCYINDSIFAANYFDITLTVTSDSGCVSTGIKNNYITVYPNPIADFTAQPGSTTITDPVITCTDLSIGVNFWNWNFGDGSAPLTISIPNPYTYADTGTYQITLIASTQFGCIDTAYQTIVIEQDFMIYIPNAFSPNGDGINDGFIAKGIFILEYEMSIFDRWGNMIYKTDNINKPWDGRANYGNEMAQKDVYIYVINVTDYNQKKHSYKGIVTLVR